MKELNSIFFILILLISCSEENEKKDPIEGIHQDTIGLSTRHIEFSSNKDSIILTTEGIEWHVISFIDNKKYLNRVKEDNYESEWIVFKRIKPNEILIKVHDKSDTIKNTLTVGFRDKGYLDNIKIVQK